MAPHKIEDGTYPEYDTEVVDWMTIWIDSVVWLCE